MTRFSSGIAAVSLAALMPFALGETVKDREGAVRRDRADMQDDPRWIYNDVERGFAEAKKTGKPLLVVLRCVPCLSCAGIDAQVIEDQSLAPLLDRFVCVRVINANALDLSKFQFDFDLSFTTMLFNGDGTIYGRYGSWTHQKDPLDKTTAGFRAALEAALALHRNYPANRAALAGKQGAPVAHKTRVEMPFLAGKYRRDLDWEGKVVQSCVHCHQIGDAQREALREGRKTLPDELIYPFPAPETIGISLQPEAVARVSAVQTGSAAERGGLKAGDEIVALAGQPLISQADISWILHRAPDAATLPVEIRRAGAAMKSTLSLPKGWRQSSDISRRVGTWPMRAMAFGGLVLEECDDSTRTRLGVPANAMALRVKGVGQYGKHAAGGKAGFRKEDVIVEIDGSSTRRTESQVIGDILRARPKGERVKFVVVRGDQRLPLELATQ
jgi:serine protease Do